MSAQLFQLLGQLDRPGATELIIATGRQVAVRVNGVFQTLTASGVTVAQLMHLIRDTELSQMVPAREQVGDVFPIDLDGRPLLAQFVKQGADLMLRIEHRPMPQPRARASSGPPNAARGPTPPPARPLTPSPIRGESPIRIETPGRAAPTQPSSVIPVTPPATAQSSPAIAVPPATATSSPTQSIPVASYSSPAAQLPPATAYSPPAAPTAPAVTFSSPAHRLPPTAAAASSPAAPPPPAALDAPAGMVDEPSEVVPTLAAMVAEARRRGATDLHIAANRPTLVRLLGDLTPLDATPAAAADVEALLLPLLGPQRRHQLAERGYVDLAVDIPGGGRLRTNVSRQQGGLKGAFRLAVAAPPSIEQLGLPPAVAKVTENHQGLVVIAGPSGHGKTTTLAALIDLLNRADPIHILTIEDPVEIVYPKRTAVVSQREVGRHTASFAAALKASLREDPDVIVIGELRDRETVEIALTAAETGHLVLATMSTPSAAKTIDRIVDMFPPDEHSQVRASLGAALKAIVAQRLLPNIEGTGVVAAVELLVGVLALANLIRDNKLFQLPNLMQRGRSFGMIRLDDSLLELVRAGKLAEEVAIRNADSKKELVAALHPPVAEAPVKRGLFSRRERE